MYKVMKNHIAGKYGRPPQALPLFVDTKDSIPRDTQAVLDAQRAVRDNIVSAFTPDTATFEGVMEAIARDNSQANLKTRLFSFYQKVSPCPELCDASSKARQAVADFDNESLMRQDIFELIDALYKKRNSLHLDAENLRLLERTHRTYISHGMGITDGPQRDRLREIKTRINSLRTEFNKNLNSEDGGLWFTPAELEGVPDDVVSNLEKGSGENEGKLWLTFKYPHLLPTLKYAINPETRKKFAVANENKVRQIFSTSVLICTELLTRNSVTKIRPCSKKALFFGTK
jgi:metallopeptidase MepB